jgi:hypothetical protein
VAYFPLVSDAGWVYFVAISQGRHPGLSESSWLLFPNQVNIIKIHAIQTSEPEHKVIRAGPMTNFSSYNTLRPLGSPLLLTLLRVSVGSNT